MSSSAKDGSPPILSGSRFKIIEHALGSPTGDTFKNIPESPPHSAFINLEASLLSAGRIKDAERVKLAHVVADAVHDHVDLAATILDDPGVTSTRDVALRYGVNRVMNRASKAKKSDAKVLAASIQPAPAEDETAKTMALGFRQRLFEIEPTAVLQQMLSIDDGGKDPVDDLPIHASTDVRKEVAKFLDRHPTFDIRNTSILAPLERDQANLKTLSTDIRAAVTDSLKLLQRVQALTPAPEAVKPLLEQGLTSAMRVSSTSKKQFVAKVAPHIVASGAPAARADSLASRIHDHAMTSRLRTDNALIQINQMVKGTSLVAIDGNSSLSDRRLMANTSVSTAIGSPESINLTALFGDVDMCECEACLDVTSPTAYYVDLLQYLRNNDLDYGSKWDNTGKEGIAGTALEKFFQRRPDLQHLQLTCANANTVLPMIDLGNEVMEAFIIHAGAFASSGTTTIETWNIDSETSEELLASSSHTRKKAYCILKESVYPISSLPYFQPLDACRLYLNYLGSSRFELIDTLRLARSQWPIRSSLITTSGKVALYNALRAQVQDRAVAAEYLGLSPDEYVIITRESLWSIGCSEFADNGVVIDVEDYRKDIGVLPSFAYWGYHDETELLSMNTAQKTGLAFVKAQFLVRSGLSYSETSDLLRTKFVNPMMATGKNKVLLDSIRFSYRFLQYITVGTVEESQKKQLRAEFLSSTQPWVHYILLQQIPPTGNPLVAPDEGLPTFTQAEIKAWVTDCFDCLGKLVVLEAGEGPRLPCEGYLVWEPPARDSFQGDTVITRAALLSSPDSTPKILGYLDSSGELRDEKNELTGFVWMDSRIYYNGLRLVRTQFPSGKISLLQVARQNSTLPLDALESLPILGPRLLVDEGSNLVWPDKQPPTVTWTIPADTCSIDNTKIVHLNGTTLNTWEWDRVNRFIRLYKKLQSWKWTILELDAALIALWDAPELQSTPNSPSSDPLTPLTSDTEDSDAEFSFTNFKDKGCGCDDDDTGTCDDGDKTKCSCDPSSYMDISPGFVKELMSVQKLAQISGQDLERLLCLWSDIGTFGVSSLYSRLFLTYDILAMDAAFKADANGNYFSGSPKIGDHIPAIVAALRIKPKIFDAILQRVGLTRDSIIDIGNLTRLYRHMLLSNILGVKPEVLLQALDLFPDPYRNASTTLDMYSLFSRVLAASFSIQQLRYITLGLDDPLRPTGPAPLTVLRSTQTIMSGLLSIADTQPDLTAQEEAVLTAAQVKTKATLFFEPSVVDDIVGLIEGTRLYSTNAPVGLVVDKSKVPAKVFYNDPLTPPNRRATLSVKGCLTESELSNVLALFPGNAAWSSALQRVRKQAESLVRNELGSLFAGNLDDAVAFLTQGDTIATDPAGTDPGNLGTALTKRIYFMRKFMPYLRSYLESKIITTTMSSVASVTAEMCAWLLNDVIKVGPKGSQSTAMEVLRGLKNYIASDASTPWIGYLIPPSTDTYVFYGYGDTKPLALMLDGINIPFIAQNEDPSNLWWTAPVTLVGGKVLRFRVEGQAIPGDLQWKTARSRLATVPANSLIPDTSISDANGIFEALLKASMLIQGFSLNLTEVGYLQDHGESFSNLDFGNITFEAWKRLLQYYELRKSLVSREKSLIDLFKWATLKDDATTDEISKMISDVTTWDLNSIKILIDKKNFDLEDVKLFRNESAISKLANVLAFMAKIGIDNVSLLLSWTDLKLDFDPTWKLAKSIRQTIRGKYTMSDYEQAIKPSHDQLRKNQRDALIAYLLVFPAIQQWGVTDADGLFEFFLLDVQMGSCMQTSRTKQAISSAQLFVQRCMLGLEERYGVANDALDAERWQWMSKQTVWTANRKVFLWPENWMISSLRDDKTPIYTDMESEMLQRDVNPGNVLESFKTYVTKLDQIAHLRAFGVYVEQQDTDKFIFHCVAMTVESPYLFFYRTYDFFAHEWTPWVRITATIPTYTIDYSTLPTPSLRAAREDASTMPGGRQPVDSFTGCYVVPIAWQSRRLIFIGEITQKAVPNDTALDTNFGSFTKPDSTTNAKNVSPLSVLEVKVSWTEYRSGKWTNKQVASEALKTASFTDNNLPPIDRFQFIPHVDTSADGTESVIIEIWRSDSGNPYFEGNYVFNGTNIQTGSLISQNQPKNWIATSFQLIGGRSAYFTASSLQKSPDGTTLTYLNTFPFVAYTSEEPNGIMHYIDESTDIFYHSFTSKLVSTASGATEVTGIDSILNVYRSLSSGTADLAFGTGPPETGANGASYPTFAELSKPYTNYNWELGFFGPIEVATALLTGQQFDQALAMIYHVFDPYADGPDISRVWKWLPFKTASAQRVLETFLNQLKPHQFDLNITKWRDSPFHPFVVARGRTVSYMKWTVMLYIKILIAYGDMYFRRRTLEDIPLAIQIYTLASHMYGPKGETIPKRGRKRPQTYFSLMDKWDAFSNAVVQLEIAFPYSNQTPFPWAVTDGNVGVPPTTLKQITLANLYGSSTSSYFCLPSNPDLKQLRATIDQRMYNIRHCLDIDGRPMPVPLWDPPLDPGQLVAAVASGLSLSSALSDLNTTLPNYRFTWLIARALEMTGELKSLEATFLSIKEKQDSEALQLLRSGHELTINKMVMEMKKVQLEEANKTLVALGAGQESSKLRFQFYSKLAGLDTPELGTTSLPFKSIDIDIDHPSTGDTHLNSTEAQEETQAIMAQFWTGDAANLEIMAGILHALPSFNVHATPMGCGVEVAWGMPNIAAAFSAQARQSQAYSSDSNFSSSQAARKATYIKQYQDRVHQMNLAGLEYEHINAQMDAQNTRITIANMDIANQQQLIDNAQEVNDFLTNKYTNEDLYNYMESTLRTAMYQTYLLAYDLAKKAELAFRFERRQNAVQSAVNFVSYGYFNPARDGLQASHQLYLALKFMDAAYQESRGHDYEITKSISLRQMNPYQLLTLRETGSCTFDVPEVAFDTDFPGHFFRRIKTVSLTVPCIVGPHTGVNATLRLLKHRYRNDALATSSRDYVEDTSSGSLDARFRTDMIPIDAVAASSAQNDAGAFELSLKDERFVPFEGAGAISSWQLTLPPTSFRPFDYASIADVILSMRYTACEGGEVLRKAAADSVVDWIGTIESASKEVGLLAMWDIRAEFAAEWAKLSGPAPGGNGNNTPTLVLRALNSRLPAFVAGRDPSKVRATDVTLVTTLALSQAADLSLNFKYVPGSTADSGTSFDSGPSKVGTLNLFRIDQVDDAIGDWALTLNLGSGVAVDAGSRMWLIVRYRLIK